MLQLLRRLFRPNPAASQLPPEDQGDDVLAVIGAPAIEIRAALYGSDSASPYR